MSQFSHTDTAVTGGQMLATDVTVPDGALDASIGDKATLLTTIKTSIVAAINENVTSIAAIVANSWVTAARIATGAVTTAKIAAGAVTTTELGANAVTTAKLAAAAVTATELASNAVTTAKITDANVTGPKLAPAEFTLPNGVPDSMNQWLPVDLTQERGTLIWFPRSSNALLQSTFQVVADGTNPYGGKSLKMLGASASAVGGKFINCRTYGVEAGQKMMAAVRLNCPVGSTFQLILRSFDAAGGFITGDVLVANTVSGVSTGAEQLIKTGPYTVPAGAAYVLPYLSRTGTAQDALIYSIWSAIGTFIGDYPTASTDHTWFWQEIVDARLGYGALSDRLGGTTDLTFGRNYMQTWDQKTANWKLSTGGTKIKVMLLGDSWVQNAAIRPVLRAALQGIYGNGGIGWIDAAVAVQSGTNDDGYTWARVGTWDSPELDINTSALAVGPNGADASTSDVATPAKLSVTYTAETVNIHYWKQPSGGDFEYQQTYNGVASGWTTVATANGTEIHGVTAVTTSGIAFPTLLEIRAKVAGSAGIRLLGTEWIKTGINLVWYPLGHNSTTVAKWNSMTAAKWQANITALAPDIVIIVLGTNDKTAAVVPATFTAGLTTLIGRLRAAMPLVDVLLVSPGNNGEVAAYPMSDYDAAMRAAAVANRAGFISGYAHLDIHADNQTRLMTTNTDGRHLIAAGGRMYASLLTDFLRVGP